MEAIERCTQNIVQRRKKNEGEKVAEPLSLWSPPLPSTVVVGPPVQLRTSHDSDPSSVD